jgi:hypothetical protein
MEVDTIILKKPKRVYHTKSDIFKVYREKVIEKFNIILEMNPENMSFYLYHLEHSQHKQEQIIALVPEIKRYFKCGCWSYFAKGTKKGYLSLIRSVYKDMGCVITRRNTTISVNNQLIYTQIYVINKSDTY